MSVKVPLELDALEKKRIAFDLLLDDDDDDEKKSSVNALASELVKELCENEATWLGQGGKLGGYDAPSERDPLSKALTVVKHFGDVSKDNKVRVADCLGSNLSVLNATIDATAAEVKQRACQGTTAMVDGQEREDLETLAVALKIHLCLLDGVLREACAFGTKNPDAGKAKRGARASASAGGWEWLFAAEKCLRPLSCSAGLDFGVLLGGDPKHQEAVLQKLTGSAIVALNCTPCISSGQSGSQVRESLARLLASACHKLTLLDGETAPAIAAEEEEKEEKEETEGEAAEEESKLDAVLPAFVDAINKQEAASGVLVDACAYAAQALGNAKIAKSIVAELAKVDPRDYKHQQQSDAQGVKNVSLFFVEVSEKLPQVMTSCLSVVVPHLGGEAYNLRSGIVQVIARILVHSSKEGGAASKTYGETFLKSKQHFLKILVERVFDVSAFTRSKTLQSWAYLCQHKAIPIGYWNYIAEIAIGRLEDKAALVRKSAMHLLSTMLQYNPFAPCLPVQKFEASLQEYQQKLEQAEQEKGPAGDEEGAEEVGEEGERAEDPEVSSLRALVASLDAAVKFCRHLTSSLDVVAQLLASSSITDATEAISFIVLLCQFQIQGSDGAARRILPLIFSHEQTVKDAVIDGFAQLYVRDGGPDLAQVLSKLAVSLNVGEVASLRGIFKELWQKKIVDHALVDDLLALLPANAADAFTLQGALHLLSLVAAQDPELVVESLDQIVQAGFGGAARRNPYVYRSCCEVLTSLPAGSYTLKADSAVFGKIAQIVSGRCDHIPPLQWYSVAEACISALYKLADNPETSCCAMLREMSTMLTGGESGALSVAATSRFLFAAGQVAVKHLVHIENLGSRVRHSGGKAAGNAKAQGEEEEDIADQIGAGAAAADAALDNLVDECEREIMHGSGVISICGPLLSSLCRDKDLMGSHVQLRVAASLALTKLMCLDAKYCEENLPVLFQILGDRHNETEIRSNCVIALGDLVYRFPNKLEPWTAHIYSVLSDGNVKVRKHALMVLSHLILNDMLKVKGHVSAIARLLLDEDERTAMFAELFFHELSRKTATTVYNLIPDILSNLSQDEGLTEDGFRRIMTHVLGFIQRDKQTDGLVEKLCHRFDPRAEASINRHVAFCISQLNVTEKGLKRLSENFKSFRHVFESEEVCASFQLVTQKTRKVVANRANLKAAADDLEQKIKAVVAELHQCGEEDADEGEVAEGDENATPGEDVVAAGKPTAEEQQEENAVEEPAPRALRRSNRANREVAA